MLKINDTNYELYKKVFIRIYTFMMRDYPDMITSPTSPITIIEEWEKKNMAIAKNALKLGLADMLNMMKSEMPENDKLLLNTALTEENLPGLWQLISAIRDVPAQVLKRGKINNLDEWYVIAELLSNIDSEITPEQRTTLGELSNAFEDRQRKMGR